MLVYLALKNIVSRRSSFVIMLFIAFAVMLLVVTNAVFDSTEQGIRQTFVSSFTGDIVIRPHNKHPLSLFGDETPVTGRLTELPSVVPYDDLIAFLADEDEVAYVVPQATGQALLASDEEETASFMFGVPAADYLACMDSIRVIEGEPWRDGEKGLMLTQNYAERLKVHIGDTLQFMVNEGLSSRIRAVPLTAIYEYASDNSALGRIVLVSPETVRAIMDMTELSSAESVRLSDGMEELLSDFDIDGLFEDAFDSETAVITAVEEDDDTAVAYEEARRAAYANSSSWNFVICRLHDSRRAASLIRRLNRVFQARDWPVEAVGWRSAAGAMAFYLYVLRLVLNAGIVVVLAAGFIVVNNTLVISVLDRTREIGTMRAIGASRRYISAECAAETLLMALAAGVVGCLLGIVASALVTAARVTFSNSFLIQLFGGTTLRTAVRLSNLASAFLLALVLGLVAWIYPVTAALRASPVEAMQGAK